MICRFTSSPSRITRDLGPASFSILEHWKALPVQFYDSNVVRYEIAYLVQFNLESTGTGEHVVICTHTGLDLVNRREAILQLHEHLYQMRRLVKTHVAELAGTNAPS